MADTSITDLFFIDTTTVSGVPITAAEAGYLGGAVAGTASGEHCVVLNSSRNITNIGSISFTGNLSGNIITGDAISSSTAFLTGGVGTGFTFTNPEIDNTISGSAIQTNNTLTIDTNKVPSNHSVIEYLDTQISSISIPPQWNFIDTFNSWGTNTLGFYNFGTSPTKIGFRFLINTVQTTSASNVYIQFGTDSSYTGVTYKCWRTIISDTPSVSNDINNTIGVVLCDPLFSPDKLYGVCEGWRRDGDYIQVIANTTDNNNETFITSGTVMPSTTVDRVKVVTDTGETFTAGDIKLWLYY